MRPGLTDARRSLPSQLRNFLCQLVRLLLQLPALLFQQLLPFRRQFIQHAGLPLAQLAKLVIGTFPQAIQRFEHRDDFQLQRLMQPPQLREFRLVAEIQGRPALTQDEAVRVFRDFPQRLDVARVLRPVDGVGQLVIRLQLV